MSDTLMGVTEINAASKAEISNLAQSYLQQASMLMSTVTDYSSYAVKGAKSVSVPRSAGFTPESKLENTGLSAQSLTYNGDVIAFDIYRAVQFLNEDIAEMQCNIDLVADMVKKASMDLGKDFDSYIVAQLKLAASSPDHTILFKDTSTDVIAADDILSARKLLQNQYIDPRECYCGIGPEKESEILGIANFVQSERWGNSMPIQQGVIGSLFGFKVIVNTLFEDFACFWHPTAIGYAMQKKLTFESMPDLEHLGTRYSLSYLGGVKVLDSGLRNVFIDSTN